MESVSKSMKSILAFPFSSAIQVDAVPPVAGAPLYFPFHQRIRRHVRIYRQTVGPRFV